MKIIKLITFAIGGIAALLSGILLIQHSLYEYDNNGCCLKNFYDGYLFRLTTADFSGQFRFINPTFYPKEKIIRSVAYGHPWDTDLYTYIWNGFKVDMVEHISPDRINQGKYIRYNDSTGIETSIESVPNEYRKIFGYDWFLGNVPWH